MRRQFSLSVNRPTSGSRQSRGGFTLAEVLVTLAIIAVMAAVLLPALNQQIAKGDTGRLASDLTNIQTGAQAFVSDVHRYPGTVAQLTTAVTGNDINGDAIPAPLQAKWKGPYLGRDALTTTGNGGTISPTFTATVSGAVSYFTITVTGLTLANFSSLESVLDEGTSGASSSTAGSIRYSAGTVTFLALPIQ